MPTASNLVVGAASSVKIGAYGAVEGDCDDLGATLGGVKFEVTEEQFDLKADQWVGIVGVAIISREMGLEFDIAENSLTSIAHALGKVPATVMSGTTLSLSEVASVNYKTVFVNGIAVGGGTLKLTGYKCVVEVGISPEMKKDDQTVYHMKLKIIQDTSKGAGVQFGTLVYSSTDTTPPTVAMTTPAEDGTVVASGSGTLTLTFTEATNAIDESTLIAGETVMVVNVEDPTATVEKAVTISYNSGTKVLTVTPVTAWGAAGQNYEIIITKSVRDTAGNKMAATFVGHFLTA